MRWPLDPLGGTGCWGRMRDECWYILSWHQNGYAFGINRHLGGRAAVELAGRLEIRAGLAAGAAAAEEEAQAEEDPSSGWRGRERRAHAAGARRGAEEVLEDGHGEEHGDEDGRGHEPEGHRADAAVQLPPPHLVLRRRRRPGCRSHRRPARHGAHSGPVAPFPLTSHESRRVRRHCWPCPLKECRVTAHETRE